MSYKKFKPELSDKQVDDLEKAGQTTHSKTESDLEEQKTTCSTKVFLMLMSGQRQEFECDLETTKIKDVIAQAFKQELSDGKKVNILFAGKILCTEKTLSECKVQNNFVIHAIVKKNVSTTDLENADNNEPNQQNEISKSYCAFWIDFDQSIILILGNIATFSDFLQRAEIIRNQINDQLNRENPRVPNRGRNARSNLQDRSQDQAAFNEEESNRCIKEVFIGLFTGFLLRYYGVFIMCFCNCPPRTKVCILIGLVVRLFMDISQGNLA
ncbi:unnamed protein product [Moneuplotes crassus]|uniref:Ubiquitin-like domain-containing protein n=1 Tax=Euplotes crassus TaxID=5936 RepID=A0AAD1XSR5_EUPCR|nr:unnamed protein product [Moneuplotes crassus]